MLFLKSHSIRNIRDIPREETLLILPVMITFPGDQFLATSLLRSELGWLLGLDWDDCPGSHSSSESGTQSDGDAKRQSWHPGWIMRAALKSHSKDTGILYLHPQVQVPSYTHVEVVLRHCDSHPAAASQHCAPLSAMSTSRFSELSVPACTAESCWLCALRLPKDCSLQSETQAASLEGYPILNNMPDATLLTAPVFQQG